MSYEQAEQDLAEVTGMRIPAKTQQRSVHCRTLPLPGAVEPVTECVDGGIRRRTPLGEACAWRTSKAIATAPRFGCQLAK